LEIKREWYKFDKPGKNEKFKVESEFLKDIVALANTPGPIGYLIIGIDKNGDLYNSPFKNSGLKDQVNLRDLVVKNVNLLFNFEFEEFQFEESNEKLNKVISIFLIPPSLDKPHFINRYVSKSDQEIKNYVPIRKSTGVVSASRSDFEYMYYDRKNIEPEYALDFLISNSHLSVRTSAESYISVSLSLAFQNYGRKPIALVNSILTIELIEEFLDQSPLILTLKRYSVPGASRDDIGVKPIVIPSNLIIFLNVEYYLETYSIELKDKLKNINNCTYRITATDILGNKYNSKDFENKN
jgi:hypothetical protein